MLHPFEAHDDFMVFSNPLEEQIISMDALFHGYSSTYILHALELITSIDAIYVFVSPLGGYKRFIRI